VCFLSSAKRLNIRRDREAVKGGVDVSRVCTSFDTCG